MIKWEIFLLKYVMTNRNDAEGSSDVEQEEYRDPK